MIHITVTSTVEPTNKATWEEMKNDIERQSWIGRSTLLQTHGGGNEPNEHSTKEQ